MRADRGLLMEGGRARGLRPVVVRVGDVNRPQGPSAPEGGAIALLRLDVDGSRVAVLFEVEPD